MRTQKFEDKSDAWKALRSTITELLLANKKVGNIANEIMQLFDEALGRQAKENTLKPRIK